MHTDPRQGKPSASSIEQMYLCPGSASAQAGLSDLPGDSSVRDAGNVIHEALAGDPLARLKLVEIDPDELTTLDGMDQKARRLAVERGFDPDNFIAEKRLWVGEGGPTGPVFSAQIDRHYLRDHAALITDFKSGFLDVTDAGQNPQLAACAVALLANYEEIDEVAVAIIPRLGRVKDVAVYDRAAAFAALAKIKEIIAAAQQPKAPRVAGDKQCKYCKAKLRCPEYHAFASLESCSPSASSALSVVNSLPAPISASSASSAVKSSLPDLPAARLADALDRISAIEGLIKSLKAEGKRRLAARDPEFCQLYMQEEPGSQRKITDLIELHRRLTAVGVDSAAFTAACSMSIEAARALLGRATFISGQELDKLIDKTIDGCCTESPKAGKLKRLADIP